VPPRGAPVGTPRHERIARVRAAIAAGCYETPDRLEQAIERLVTDLAQLS
jgi:hypothetical protein